jgi:hypothetical protein
VALSENFYLKLDFKCFRGGTVLELLTELFRHLNVLEHDLKPLGELATTLFFELED